MRFSNIFLRFPPIPLDLDRPIADTTRVGQQWPTSASGNDSTTALLKSGRFKTTSQLASHYRRIVGDTGKGLGNRR